MYSFRTGRKQDPIGGEKRVKDMICVKCGGAIKYGASICPRCEEDTEFVCRFSYQPSPAPLPGTEIEAPADIPETPRTETADSLLERGLKTIRKLFSIK